ncbi:MAG TPA: phosphoribosyltransferase [Syntrophomonas sp.]|nr:phosphoribosyltransferase [Syntrophomonas sp.]
MFTNRKEAGHLLARVLEDKQIEFDLVLGVPRGGVEVAEVIASYFNCPLDVVMAKKIASPSWDEFAIGAVTPDGETLISERTQKIIDIDSAIIEKLAQKVKENIDNRLKRYRGQRPPIDLQGKNILLVDDGIATGFTLKAAVKYLQRQTNGKIIVAVPVSSKNAYLNLLEEVDELITLEVPEKFYAVSQFYQDFAAVEDREVMNILKKYSEGKP